MNYTSSCETLPLRPKGGWSSKCTEPVGLGVIRSRVRPDASCSPTGPRIVGARLPRVAATVRHGHIAASLLISRLQASARQNDLTPTTTLWQRRSSVCARPYPSERKDHGGTSAASSTAALEYVDWFSHRRPRPPKPNASPCLPPPSPPGTPPTSVQLSTTVYQHIKPPPSIRRRQHHTTPRPTPAPNRRPNRRFLYRCWIYSDRHPPVRLEAARSIGKLTARTPDALSAALAHDVAYSTGVYLPSALLAGMSLDSLQPSETCDELATHLQAPPLSTDTPLGEAPAPVREVGRVLRNRRNAFQIHATVLRGEPMAAPTSSG